MALEWLSIASVWFKKAKGFNLYYSNWLIVVTAIIEMEQFVSQKKGTKNSREKKIVKTVTKKKGM